MRRYREPAWNNPVVRFLDGEGRDRIPRKDGIYAPGEIAERMAEALRAAEKPVPVYLEIVAREGHKLERATFAMHCFWEGEANLGAIPGVARTRAGFLGGREVVEVEFDPGAIALRDLVSKAVSLGYDPLKRSDRAKDAKPSDRKVHLRRSPLRYVAMTPTQATRSNAALARGEDPGALLSPRQRELAERVCVALRSRADLLEGLEPPEDPLRWRTYEEEVLRRLSR